MKFTIKINDPMPKVFKSWIEGDYHVSFSRKLIDLEDGCSTYRIVTTCIIIRDGMCWFGTTVKNPNDKENSFVAKKYAFSRAIKQCIDQRKKENPGIVYDAWAKNAFWKAALREPELKELLIPD